MVTLEQLAVAKDRKDKLLSRVLKKRIELDFRDRSSHSDNGIHCCRHCARLFSEKVSRRTVVVVVVLMVAMVFVPPISAI